jgi:hypothetical protein
MGLARLLAKGWIVVCLFAGAHALHFVLQSGAEVSVAVPQVTVAILLFVAMGLLFVGGYGVSGAGLRNIGRRSLRWSNLLPSFNDAAFAAFATLSFAGQVLYAPHHVSGKITDGLEGALYFAVPGHAVIVDRLGECGLDGGRVFSSAFAWFLAIVFAASAISRLNVTANIVRIERKTRREALRPAVVAAVLGIAAVLAIQCLFVGSVLALVPCSTLAGVPGAILIGLTPLLLAYLIFATLAVLLAGGSEK